LLDSSGIPWQRRTALDHKAATGGRADDSGGRADDGVAVQLPPQQTNDTHAAEHDHASVGMAPDRSPPSPFPIPPSLSPLPSPLSPRVLLVDIVGELGAWWGTARIAFVGGSMGSRGGQNMIEPAAYGAAVSFGPNTWNFRDIVSAMLDRDAAVVVEDGGQFTQFVRRCLEEPEYAAALGQRAQAMVFSQLGATQRTFRLL
jgi:hypothetical protein